MRSGTASMMKSDIPEGCSQIRGAVQTAPGRRQFRRRRLAQLDALLENSIDRRDRPVDGLLGDIVERRLEP